MYRNNEEGYIPSEEFDGVGEMEGMPYPKQTRKYESVQGLNFKLCVRVAGHTF